MTIIFIAAVITTICIAWPIIKRLIKISAKAVDKKLDDLENKINN